MQWLLTSKDSSTVDYVRDSTEKGYFGKTFETDPIPTGSNPNYSVNNIYDMAGNCSDWTMEAGDTGGGDIRIARRRRLYL